MSGSVEIRCVLCGQAHERVVVKADKSVRLYWARDVVFGTEEARECIKCGGDLGVSAQQALRSAEKETALVERKYGRVRGG